MKKLTCMLTLVGAIMFGSTAAAAGNIGITYLGKLVQTDSPPIIDKGRVLIPLRVVSEALGAKVDWSQQSQTVTIDKWMQHMSLTLGQQVAIIEEKHANGTSKETVKLDVPVKAIHNRIYISVRFASEHFGYRVDWADRTVSIKSPMSDRERANLYTGDLTTARKIVIHAKTSGGGGHYEYPALETLHPTLNYDKEFLFPKGEAFRFFYIYGDETATLFEYKDDFPVATWQAHLDPYAADPFVQLLNGRFKDATGPMPDIGGPFLYYETGFSGPTSWESSGQVGMDGKVEVRAYKNKDAADVTHVSGTIAYSLPGEIRKEAVEIPKL
ncbi:hypothetical protein GCM10010911_18550 [Paenibacillus nasutitermitis]|uniref:Copper amine oxidase-like N-terminal domain-containing protein n=2 Tax=Paenibacillus nasutitermitis TaxID=1652958 RepID=A0A916YTH1_9BACL|nr:hypothetical protein GCM10010911_18550 [Paenibacillus nasutitermitis]